MTNQNILTADFLDILFENRNKAYGAYILRKYYDRRLMQSLGIMLLIVTMGILFMSLFHANVPLNSTNYNNKPAVEIVNLKPDEPEKKAPDKPKQIAKSLQQVNKDFATFKNKPIEITEDNKVLDKDTVVDQSQLDKRANGTETKNGEKGGEALALTNPTTQPIEAGGNNFETIDAGTPMEVADIPPTYPGGIEALQNFLQRNLRSPEELDNGQSASVKVKFVVNAAGELYNYEVLQSGGSVFDNEVIRVLKKMPKWNPGRYKGQAVSVYYVIPVKFAAIEE